MDPRTSTVIGLSGASGGLGTSTLAAAVAGLAARLGGSALLVDLAPNAGGLDHLVGCAHEPGLRWPVREDGMLTLRSAHLPVWCSVRVLSQRGPVLPAPPLGPVALQTVERLADGHDVTVLDLPRPDHPRARAWLELCDSVVLVAGTTPSLVAAALVARALTASASGLVARPVPGYGLAPPDVAQVLGLPLVHQLVHDPSAPRSDLEQQWPGTGPGALQDCAAAVLSAARGASGAAA